mmetsp:Transcript_30497/g.79870  ORF Transcript_30497/g.79870 Transcript_30497/m.79870 type:complete len:884 (-) Transcript_30497:224-2875(-)
MRTAVWLELSALLAGALAQDYGPPPWCTDCHEGVVMGGADVVNFFGLAPRANMTQLGSPQFTVMYGNYSFWFLNASNAATFTANPTRYLPAWGGFCAWGISREGTDGNPSPAAEPGWPWTPQHLGPPCNPHDGWAVIGDRLFCCINRVYMDLFINTGPVAINDGNNRWENWYGSQNAGPFNTGCWPGSQLPVCMHSGIAIANRSFSGPSIVSTSIAPVPAPVPTMPQPTPPPTAPTTWAPTIPPTVEAMSATECTDCSVDVVMGGADVVNYFGTTPGTEVTALGSRNFSISYGGAVFYFYNATNAATFVADPERYIPAYGGFCAWGIAREGTDGNPSNEASDLWPWRAAYQGPPCNPHNGWVIERGRLFCAISRVVINQFINLGHGGINDADTRWRYWYGALNAGPFNTGCWPGSSQTICGRTFPNRTVGGRAAPVTPPPTIGYTHPPVVAAPIQAPPTVPPTVAGAPTTAMPTIPPTVTETACQGPSCMWGCADCVSGIVMGGADVVNYRGVEAGAHVSQMGSPQYAVRFENATFWFINASNAVRFIANPLRFIPAYGGFCSWGISREGTNGNPSPDAEPDWDWSTQHLGPPCNPHTGWVILGDRLFCAINRNYINRFIGLGVQGIHDGDVRWINWYRALNAGPFNTGCWPGELMSQCMQPGLFFTNRTIGPPAEWVSAPPSTLGVPSTSVRTTHVSNTASSVATSMPTTPVGTYHIQNTATSVTTTPVRVTARATEHTLLPTAMQSPTPTGLSTQPFRSTFMSTTSAPPQHVVTSMTSAPQTAASPVSISPAHASPVPTVSGASDDSRSKMPPVVIFAGVLVLAAAVLFGVVVYRKYNSTSGKPGFHTFNNPTFAGPYEEEAPASAGHTGVDGVLTNESTA